MSILMEQVILRPFEMPLSLQLPYLSWSAKQG